jgi:aryl-phospho-beta-D-glucosidase BglC (GH1 family)
MNYVSVDFSLNSPGICIFNTESNTHHYISYVKPGLGTKKEQKLQEDISLLSDVTLVYQPDWKTTFGDYSKNELAKVRRYMATADQIINIILGITKTKNDYIIAFEGTSYGSKMGTNNIIDMAAGAAILKEQMISQLHVKDILTVAPTTIKKFAGKGNMNKLQLFEAYQQNVNDDPILAQSPLHSMIKDLEIGKKIPKPLDDLVDAYFLVTYVSNPST